MKKIKNTLRLQALGLLAGVLVLGACSGNEGAETLREEVKFTSGTLTRVSGTAWESGDAIGIYMGSTGTSLATIIDNAANVRFTTTGGSTFTTTTPIYYPYQGNVDFVAYYPYTATVTGNALPVDVTDQADQSALEILYSNNATNKPNSATAVALQFRHILSKVEFEVELADDMPEENLDGLRIEIRGINTKGSFSLATGTLTTNTPGNVGVLMDADGEWGEAIVMPSGAVEGAHVVFTLADGQTLEAEISGSFTAGQKTVFEATLDRAKLEVSLKTAGVMGWNETTIPGTAE